jgi:hypothetical protein
MRPAAMVLNGSLPTRSVPGRPPMVEDPVLLGDWQHSDEKATGEAIFQEVTTTPDSTCKFGR